MKCLEVMQRVKLINKQEHGIVESLCQLFICLHLMLQVCGLNYSSLYKHLLCGWNKTWSVDVKDTLFSLWTHPRFKFTWTWCQCASQDPWQWLNLCTISDTLESSESVDEPPAQAGVPEEADEDKSGLVGCEPAVTHMGDATHTLVEDSGVENAGYNVMQVGGVLLTTPSAFQQLLEHRMSF